MKIKKGKDTDEFGTGVDIKLSSKDIVRAIYAYLVTRDVHINGSATITINGELIKCGNIYVDPSAKLVAKGKGWDCRKGKKQIIKPQKES